MAPRFSRPRLIDANDRQYRAHIARIMMTKGNQRPMRAPLARELFGAEAEMALRQWLGERYALSGRRLIEYLEHKGRSAIQKYRELDAVVIDAATVQIFEIKASMKASSVRRAARQLRDSKELLQMLFRNVVATILLVDTGIPKTEEDIAEIMAADDAPLDPPPTLAEVLADSPQIKLVESLDERIDGEISLLVFSVEDIVKIAGEENLHLDWDEDEFLEAEITEPADLPPVTSEDNAEGAEDSDGGAFAEALRRAMEQGNKRR